MTDHRLHAVGSARSLSSDGVLLADGSIWSQACTIGDYVKGDAFSLSPATIANCVKVFRSGYPGKISIDYEHASVSNDPVVRAAAARGEVPLAGSVLSMAGVLTAAEFDQDPTLKQTAEKLAANEGRTLDDPRNLGIWTRWKPTPKALGRIQAGELKDLSVVLHHDYPDKRTGKGQGPTIISIALTMMPFLDEMLSVAASRGRRVGEEQHDPAAGGSPATDSREEHAMSTKMLAATTALAGKPVASEDEAVVELTALGKEVTGLRSLSADLAKTLGVEPAQIVATVSTLSQKVAESEKAAKEARERELDGQVTRAMKDNEDKLVPAMATVLSASLRAELAAGTKLEETPTIKALAAMPKHNITGRVTGADTGENQSTDPDAVLDRTAHALLESEPDLKALAATDWSEAFGQALSRAAKKTGYKSEQMQRAAIAVVE